MRAKVLLRASTFAVLLAAAACGGNKPDAKAPDTSAATGAPSGAPTSTAEPGPTAPATTTTATLGDAGDQSTKIPAAPKGDKGDGPKKGQEAGRAREDIQAIIVARRDEARACYDEGLKKNPSIEGDLDIKWTIDPAGNVSEIAVDSSKSTIRDDGVGNCIIAIIKKVKFAKSDKGFETRTHYPFNFHPKAGQVGKGGAQPQNP